MKPIKSLHRRQVLQGLSATALALALALARMANAQSKVIRIGYVSPQTGPLAAFGETDNFTLAQVREALKAGIKIGNQTYAVEIIVRDSQSNPNRAAEVAMDLINKSKVQLMLCAATPDTVNPVSDQCELAEVPCVSTASPWESWYFGRGATPAKGFDWTYHFFFGLGDGIAAYTALWQKLPTNKVVGLLCPNDADGEAWADKQHGLPPALQKQGYKLVDLGRFQSGSDNYTAQITAFKKAGVEIVSGVLNPPDFTTFWNQARQQGFKPKIVTVAKAMVFPQAVDNLGTAGDGVTAEVVWSRYHPFKSSLTGASSAQVADAWEAQMKKQWTPPLGWIHALFEVGIDALRRSADPFKAAAVRDAIKATKLQTLAGSVNFSNGPMKNVSSIPLVTGQWKSGGKFKHDIEIVSNESAPAVGLTGKLRALS
jgi:branched-chain amino acid transport system substrate-binding protein